MMLSFLPGGAVLGLIRETIVTIEASDDPYGKFGFEASGSTVLEPSDSSSYTHDIAVLRQGGTLGVVSVMWHAELNGKSSSMEILSESLENIITYYSIILYTYNMREVISL